MADAMTLAKGPNEKMGAFNTRLRVACSNKDNPVTNVSILVVHGEPLVTLFSEVREITEEDVKEASEAGDEPLKIGELLPENEPLIAQVVKVSCVDDDAAAKTQRRLETLYERADGGVIELLHATGPRYSYVPAPAPSKDATLVQEHVTYVLVSYEADADTGEDDDEKDDAAMETAVRTPVAKR